MYTILTSPTGTFRFHSNQTLWTTLNVEKYYAPVLLMQKKKSNT